MSAKDVACTSKQEGFQWAGIDTACERKLHQLCHYCHILLQIIAFMNDDHVSTGVHDILPNFTLQLTNSGSYFWGKIEVM